MSKYWDKVRTRNFFALVFLCIIINTAYSIVFPNMQCIYGERGSLTAICINATPSYFRRTSYRFDGLDETLLCQNCNLTTLEYGTFDISGNKIWFLNLTGSNIEEVQNKAFIGLVYLEQLILNDNRISSFATGAFFGARRIKHIIMERALVAPLPDYAFQELYLLRELSLKDNSLTKIYNKTFSGLESLEVLDLSYNKLKTINGSLSGLKKLEQVFLNNNEIVEITAVDFSDLGKLLEINLANNFIIRLNFDLAKPNSLRKLNISYNHLGNRAVPIESFRDMDQLEILDLSFNWFQTIQPKFFQGLYNLRELILCNNTLSRFESGAFSGLPSLRILNVSHNFIDSAEITGRLSLHQLSVIDFSDNKIFDFPFVEFLVRAPRISKIDLTNNFLTCKKRRQMEAYFKDENIHFKMHLDNCPKLSEEEYKEVHEALDEDIEDLKGASSTMTGFKITLLLLVILLFAVLFYMQLFVINRKQ